MDSPLDLLGVPELDGRLALVQERLVTTCSTGSREATASSARIVGAGGKRLRPALTVAVAGLDDVFDVRVIAAAAAVELVQVGSLVHDDIFDGALTRRGTPTINAVEGRNEALLAGTYLLSRAAAEAARAGQQVAVDVARTVARLCVGQATETEHIFDVEQGMEQYLLTIEGKTAELFSCSCRVGALSADLPAEDTTRLGEYGHNFGMAFQIIDDVLDLIGDPARLGKPVGSDISSGVLTMPVLLELADGRGGDLRALLARRGPTDLRQASRMMAASGRIDEAIDAARGYADAASAAIVDVPRETRALAMFPHSYVDWALEQFLAA
jgi:geranylgeranyl pyrophosphate synthase